MRCVIVGGGIGGMALALSLHDAGLGEIEIHESAPALRELGVGINVLRAWASTSCRTRCAS